LDRVLCQGSQQGMNAVAFNAAVAQIFQFIAQQGADAGIVVDDCNLPPRHSSSIRCLRLQCGCEPAARGMSIV
jgi:hypothetical protein